MKKLISLFLLIVLLSAPFTNVLAMNWPSIHVMAYNGNMNPSPNFQFYKMNWTYDVRTVTRIENTNMIITNCANPGNIVCEIGCEAIIYNKDIPLKSNGQPFCSNTFIADSYNELQEFACREIYKNQVYKGNKELNVIVNNNLIYRTVDWEYTKGKLDIKCHVFAL